MTGVALSLTIDDAEISAALARLVTHTMNLKPAFEDIGHTLVRNTQVRFEAEQAPDGTAWQPDAAATLVRKSKKGLQKILQSSVQLLDSITYLASRFELALGTNKGYAAIHQLGGTDDMAPGPAAIPARPFLGLSRDDEAMIGRTLVAHLGGTH